LTQYYDPKNEPGGDKRMLLVFLLVMIGMAAVSYFTPKPTPPTPQSKPGPQQQEQPAATPAPTPAPKTATKAPKSPAPSQQNIPAKQAASQSTTTIENKNYRIVFNNHGAVVEHWILKDYKDDKGNQLDLVNPVTAPVLGYPLSFFTYDQGLQKKLNDAMYVASATGNQTAPASITFEYSDGQIAARKTFKFDDSYVIGIETQVSDNGNLVQAFPQWPGGLGDQTVPSSYAGSRIDWEQNDKITRKPPQSGWFLTGKSWVVGGQTLKGPFNWVSMLDSYFAAAFMPESPQDAAIVTFHTEVEVPRDLNKPNEGEKAKAPVLGVAVGEVNGITRERFFLGPKSVDELEKIQAQPSGPDLRGIIDWGFFGVISRPLFAWLKWTHNHWIHNWGWAIAFLTVVITGVLLPLRISSLKSSLKMQKIQPQVKAIQEKYKRYSITDPRKAQMQQEMAALYKKEGVNPVGGCFPMLLQMPFLFAFYSMLGNAIDLRQANWLWIHDLSAADPLHILPIAIIVTMFLSQKSMPQAGMDPAQQKMLSFLTPVMLGLISWNLAAGLGVYWAISNVLGWVQQVVINRTEFGKQVRKTVEKRAVRKR
jgi:YidC/Oxa1 family membrane protein insertase